MKNIILELTVRNHPGVMSHVSGLFSRRGYNIEGILCGKLNNNTHSRIFLMINDNEKLDLIIKQIKKLEDVVDVSMNNRADMMFRKLGDFCNRQAGFTD